MMDDDGAGDEGRRNGRSLFEAVPTNGIGNGNGNGNGNGGLHETNTNSVNSKSTQEANGRYAGGGRGRRG
jgi:hypothetical protein